MHTTASTATATVLPSTASPSNTSIAPTSINSTSNTYFLSLLLLLELSLPIVLPNNRISAMLPIASLLRYSNIGWEDYLSIESFGIDHYLHSFFIRTIPRTSERGRPKLRTVGGPPGLAFNCTLGTGRIFVTGHSPLHTSTYYRSGRRTTRSECGYQVSKSYQSNSLFTFPFLR